VNKNNFDLDNKITKTFKLFSGLRSTEEDQKIFDRVYELCFEEIVKFLYENLSKDEQTKLILEIKRNSEKERLSKKQIADINYKTLLNYLVKIENYRFKLDKRLDYFINNLLYSSLNNLSSN
jgi:hypothetical protein